MGIHAMGDIGRSIWKTGFNVVNAPRTHPIHSPNGTAKATASRNPVPTRNRDAPMCPHSVPFLISSPVPVTTCHGVGKMTLCVSMTTSHHAPISSAMTVSEGRSFLSLSISVSVPALLRLHVSSSCTRHRIRAHGDAGQGSTTMVICPLRCAVQANV